LAWRPHTPERAISLLFAGLLIIIAVELILS
jgi:hypothetical protein